MNENESTLKLALIAVAVFAVIYALMFLAMLM